MNTCTLIPFIFPRDKIHLLSGFDSYVIPFTYHNATLSKQASLDFHCAISTKPYRGTHLVPLRIAKLKCLDAVESHIKAMASLWPYATAWDAVHENWCLGNWKYTNEHLEFTARAIELCRKYAPNSKLFISEFRPQNKERWLYTFQLIEKLESLGTPIDGVSIQLHCNLLNKVENQTQWIKPYLLNLRAKGYELHCYEVMVFDLLTNRVKFRPPTKLAELMQSDNYFMYRNFAESIGASLFGCWHPWDGSLEKYWYAHETSPGLYRSDFTPKPSLSVFLPDTRL